VAANPADVVFRIADVQKSKANCRSNNNATLNSENSGHGISATEADWISGSWPLAEIAARQPRRGGVTDDTQRRKLQCKKI